MIALARVSLFVPLGFILRLFRFVENLGISGHTITGVETETEFQIDLDPKYEIRSYLRIFSNKSCALHEVKRDIITSNIVVPAIRTFLVSFNVAFMFTNEALVLFKAIKPRSRRFCKEKLAKIEMTVTSTIKKDLIYLSSYLFIYFIKEYKC